MVTGRYTGSRGSYLQHIIEKVLSCNEVESNSIRLVHRPEVIALSLIGISKSTRTLTCDSATLLCRTRDLATLSHLSNSNLVSLLVDRRPGLPYLDFSTFTGHTHPPRYKKLPGYSFQPDQQRLVVDFSNLHSNKVRLTIADVRRPVKSAGFHPSYGYRRPTLYRSRYTFTTHISTLKVLADPDSHKFRKFVKIFLLNFDPPSPSVDGKHSDTRWVARTDSAAVNNDSSEVDKSGGSSSESRSSSF
ncbi:hypothetical protein RRG08_048161 [Elysia crispata]|uniref:Uncharacterized protein n=1 Tax=Elysia crispata TaxID=231223 RepID=A0AAE1DGQ4_9GAST|nr:hypothetical protein RRG08_048161 [Elysia crispata]